MIYESRGFPPRVGSHSVCRDAPPGQEEEVGIYMLPGWRIKQLGERTLKRAHHAHPDHEGPGVLRRRGGAWTGAQHLPRPTCEQHPLVIGTQQRGMQRARGRGDGGHTEIALSAVKGLGSVIFLSPLPQPPCHPILLESSESLHTDILNFQSTQARQNRSIPSVVSWTNYSRSWKALCPALWRGSFCSVPYNWK